MNSGEADAARITQSVISPDHPSLAGHFPGNPIVPGVVLLDEVLAALREWQPDFRLASMPSVKFLNPLRPGEPFSIRLEQTTQDFRFECFTPEHLLAKGALRSRASGA